MTIQEQLEEANDSPESLENDQVNEEQSQEEEDNSSQSDIEEQARAMGWKPLDEYDGVPENHIPAEKFVRRGMGKLPVLQKNFKELQDKYTETDKALREIKEYQAHIGKKQYEKALKDIQEQQRQAVEDGDTKAFDELEKQKSEAQKEYEPPKAEPSEYDRLQQQKVLLNWNKKNEWYQKDKTLQIEADIAFKELELSGSDLPLQEKLTYVEQKVRESNPNKFSQRRQSTPPSVHGDAGRKVEKGDRKTWNDIPEKDRASANQWISKGVVTKEQYIKDYFAE